MRRESSLPEDRSVALRPGLWGGRHVRDGIDGYLVFDPLTQRQEFIKGEQAQVLWRLGAGQRPSALPAELLPSIKELWRRGWLSLATAEDTQQTDASANKEEEHTTEGFQPRPGASFSCGACGLCCRAFHDIGPVQESEREQILSAAALIERTRQRSAAEILQLSPPEHPSAYWPYQIATQKGRCLFLTPKNLCSIHEKVGGEQKPLVCQMFPIQLAVVNGQPRMLASSRCPSVSLMQGAPLDPLEGQSLWRKGAPVLQPREPECGWDAYTEAERELLSALDDPACEDRDARRTAFSAAAARLGSAFPEAIQVGRLYATARRLEIESKQKGGEPLAAVAWGMRWSLHQRSKSPSRPWQDAFLHVKASRSAGESLRRYLADQVYAGELLQHQSVTEGLWRLHQRSLLIEAHARALVQSGASKEAHATAESIYLWDFATMTEAWQFLSPNKNDE